MISENQLAEAELDLKGISLLQSKTWSLPLKNAKGQVLGALEILIDFVSSAAAKASRALAQQQDFRAFFGRVLILEPLQGRLKRDTETLSKMDPYVQLEQRGLTQKSRVCRSGSLTPQW